jgi:hypothetical protein
MTAPIEDAVPVEQFDDDGIAQTFLGSCLIAFVIGLFILALL